MAAHSTPRSARSLAPLPTPPPPRPDRGALTSREQRYVAVGDGVPVLVPVPEGMPPSLLAAHSPEPYDCGVGSIGGVRTARRRVGPVPEVNHIPRPTDAPLLLRDRLPEPCPAVPATGGAVLPQLQHTPRRTESTAHRAAESHQRARRCNERSTGNNDAALRHNPPLTEQLLELDDTGAPSPRQAMAEYLHSRKTGVDLFAAPGGLSSDVDTRGPATLSAVLRRKPGATEKPRSTAAVAPVAVEAERSPEDDFDGLQALVDKGIAVVQSIATPRTDDDTAAPPEENMALCVRLRQMHLRLHPLDEVCLAHALPAELVDKLSDKPTAAPDAAHPLPRYIVEHERQSGGARAVDFVTLGRGYGGPLNDPSLPKDPRRRLAYLRRRQQEAEAHFSVAHFRR